MEADVLGEGTGNIVFPYFVFHIAAIIVPVLYKYKYLPIKNKYHGTM